MELHAVDRALSVLERRDGRITGRRSDGEAIGRTDDRSAVAHPYVLLFGDTLAEEQTPLDDVHLGAPVLAASGTHHLATQLLRDQLRAVTDAEDRDAQLIDARIDTR